MTLDAYQSAEPLRPFGDLILDDRDELRLVIGPEDVLALVIDDADEILLVIG